MIKERRFRSKKFSGKSYKDYLNEAIDRDPYNYKVYKTKKKRDFSVNDFFRKLKAKDSDFLI